MNLYVTSLHQLIKLEPSLWKALPHYLRRLSNALKKHTGRPLPLTCTPIRFGKWMGGDREGNPNVTTKVIKIDVSLLSRWMAIDLYTREVDNLIFKLSMNQCSNSLSHLADDITNKFSRGLALGVEPYNKASKPSCSWLPTQLPAQADAPSCTECNEVESHYPCLDVPGSEYKPLKNKDEQVTSSPSSSTINLKVNIDGNQSITVTIQ